MATTSAGRFKLLTTCSTSKAMPSTIGKQVGRDAVLEKVTYPALLGIEPSRQRATELMQQGIAALSDFGPRAERLRQIAAYIVSRNV